MCVAMKRADVHMSASAIIHPRWWRWLVMLLLLATCCIPDPQRSRSRNLLVPLRAIPRLRLKKQLPCHIRRALCMVVIMLVLRVVSYVKYDVHLPYRTCCFFPSIPHNCAKRAFLWPQYKIQKKTRSGRHRRNIIHQHQHRHNRAYRTLRSLRSSRRSQEWIFAHKLVCSFVRSSSRTLATRSARRACVN